MSDWRDEMYHRCFEQTCRFVEAGLRDKAITRADLQRLLDTAYVDEGNDWLGRGAVYDIDQAAKIAAYEHVLAELAAADE